jgi:transcriptional regulator with XRE-family HTH domain
MTPQDLMDEAVSLYYGGVSSYRGMIAHNPTYFKVLRVLANLTLQDVADALDVSKVAIHNWENGQNTPMEHNARTYVSWLVRQVDVTKIEDEKLGSAIRTMRARIPADPWGCCDERLAKARASRGAK